MNIALPSGQKGHLTFRYFESGVTQVFLDLENSVTLFGETQCSEEDAFDHIIGRRIAIQRMIKGEGKDLSDEDKKYLISRFGFRLSKKDRLIQRLKEKLRQAIDFAVPPDFAEEVKPLLK